MRRQPRKRQPKVADWYKLQTVGFSTPGASGCDSQAAAALFASASTCLASVQAVFRRTRSALTSASSCPLVARFAPWPPQRASTRAFAAAARATARACRAASDPASSLVALRLCARADLALAAATLASPGLLGLQLCDECLHLRACVRGVSLLRHPGLLRGRINGAGQCGEVPVGGCLVAHGGRSNRASESSDEQRRGGGEATGAVCHRESFVLGQRRSNNGLPI